MILAHFAMPIVTSLEALEILDSRGRPTVAITCQFDDRISATVQVPSGASTGRAEAHELRDGDPRRHAGLGCRKAVASVLGEIQGAIAGQEWDDQARLDRALIDLDGTPSKCRLGANAILGVSLAFARVCARQKNIPLHEHFASLAFKPTQCLPRPMVNLFSGGKHAGGQVAIQDVLLVPCTAQRMDVALEQICAVYHAAAKLCARKYGSRSLVADEGGLAPCFPDTEAMLSDSVEAIENTGLVPGREMALAVDVAASHFHVNGVYQLDGKELNSAEMIDYLDSWRTRFPIISFEDGLAEDDWDAWPLLRARMESQARVLGDDFLCTNPERIRRAIRERAADALLLKVNQIGTLTEALEARKLARKAGWSVTISARSGETEDDWLADLAVGWAGDHIKIGSITRSERLAKYNRLLAIEATQEWRLAALAPPTEPPIGA